MCDFKQDSVASHSAKQSIVVSKGIELFFFQFARTCAFLGLKSCFQPGNHYIFVTNKRVFVLSIQNHFYRFNQILVHQIFIDVGQYLRAPNESSDRVQTRVIGHLRKWFCDDKDKVLQRKYVCAPNKTGNKNNKYMDDLEGYMLT